MNVSRETRASSDLRAGEFPSREAGRNAVRSLGLPQWSFEHDYMVALGRVYRLEYIPDHFHYVWRLVES